MQKTPTVYDVAAHAGVSIATVSRVFRRPDDVRASTRDTVLASVRALGYVPSASARGLAARRTGVLGLFFPDFDDVDHSADADPFGSTERSANTDPSGSTDPGSQEPADTPTATVEIVSDPHPADTPRRTDLYFDAVLRGSEVQAWRDGFTLMIGVGRGSNPVEMVTDIAGRVDGLALLAHSVPDAILEHVSRRVPIVLIAGDRQGDDYDHVTVANAEGMHALVAHLVDDLGVRDFAFVSGPEGSPDDQERYDGFRLALERRGLDAQAVPVVRGDFTRSGGRAVGERLLAAPAPLPRALVCSNDQTALGVMSALAAAGVSVPGDVIVTGFDGIEEGRLSSPPLTTVEQPMLELGRAAMSVMRRRLDDPEQAPISVRLPVKVLLRGSSEPVS